MDVDAWLSKFGESLAVGELELPAAAMLVKFVERHASHLAKIVEARHCEGRELVVIDFQTGRPQKSVYPIKRVERIGALISDALAMPLVCMLRADFPDTPHQQLAIEGAPRVICIDDRNWAEARLTWTPAELMHRILTWFSRAAHGELHDVRQPLEPVLFGSFLSFIISRDALHRADELDLIGLHDSDQQQILRVRPVRNGDRLTEQTEPICLVAYRIPPENMKRLSFAPETVGSLADMLGDRGVDLFADLRARFTTWLDQGEAAAWRILSRFAVIVEMPIVAPDGSRQDGTDLRAFITDQPVGEIAVALGLALKIEHSDEGSKVGYVKAIPTGPVDVDAIRTISAQSAEVHYEFDRKLATQLAARSFEDEREVVMVGAGAIGAHIADCLTREGQFRWTIIDDDRLLPHNIARHIARGGDVAKEKAELVANAVSDTITESASIANAIAANVMTGGSSRDEIDRALEQAGLVIDATASVVAARYLSDHRTVARRTSVFFNPIGNAAVLLAEPADRSLTLRDLEAQYLGLVARDKQLEGHLAHPDGTYPYTGACRAITNLIPQSRVMALSGIVSGGLGRVVGHDESVIRIWSMSEMGAVEFVEVEPEPVEAFDAGDWTIFIDHGLIERVRLMRDNCLPDETGGVLTGVIDIPEKLIHLVDAAPAPMDSSASRVGFTRGTAGVQECLNLVFEQTHGQVRYVGEWHSHPPRAGTHPSATDLVQIDWLATLFDMDTLPALMLIAGDRDMSLILGNREAVHLDGPDDHLPKQTTGGSA